MRPLLPGFARRSWSVRRRRPPAGDRFRPRLESLERRLLLTTIHWINPNGGSWDVASNWDLNRVPGAGDDVVIDPAGGTGTVTYSDFNNNPAIHSLYSTLPFTLAGILRVLGPVQVDNDFEMTGGGLAGGTIVAGTTLWIFGGGVVLSDVTLDGDLAILRGQVELGGAWSNHGTIAVNGGSLDFYGPFPASAIGHLVHTSGDVNLDGTMDNTGHTLVLDDTTGSFQMVNGGTIHGGTVVANGSNRLVTNYSGTLDGVVYNGSLDVSQGHLAVENGLTLNGTLTVGTSGAPAQVVFQGPQTLTGNGTVVLAHSPTPSALQALNGTVTLAPTITVHGGTGVLSNVINRGRIDAADATANLTLNGTWRNEGVIDVGPGTANLGGTFSTAGVGDFHGAGGTVNLTGTLDNTNRTLRLDAATGSWRLAGGTIRGGTVTATAGAALVPTNQVATLDGVRLTADVAVPTGTALAFTGTWANQGVLTVSGGTLNLGGTFTPAAVGTIHHTSGVVNVTGTVNNSGSLLWLNADTGSWRLQNGAISGGLVVMTEGAQLVSTGPNNRLAGVTVNGYLNVTDGTLAVDNGLTLNGILAVGSGPTSANVVFEGTQTLAGAATVLLGGSPANSLSDTNGVVTLGAAILIQAGSGRLSDFVCQGPIDVSTPDANLTLGGNGDGWHIRGGLTLTAGTLNLGSANNTFTAADLGTFTRSGGTVNLAGNLDNTGRTLNLNAATGSWLINGGRITGGTLTTTTGASLIPTGNEGTLTDVTLNTDLNIGGNARLALAGNWVNHGTLTVTGGTLDLGGTMTVANLGQIHGSGGTVNLTGTLNNTGTTLTLDDVTGSWALVGGAISGGTVATQGGASLLARSSTSQLDGVTLDGTLDVEGASVTVTDGLTLNGSVMLGRLPGGGGQLAFPGFQKLNGTGTVTFGASPNNTLRGANGTVMLGPGITVQGGYGQLSSFINQGTIAASDSSANLTFAGGWHNDGTVLLPDGTLNLGGTFTATDLGTSSAAAARSPSRVPW